MKKLSITLLLAVMVLGLSSCDSHFWSTLSGSRWFAIEEVQGNFSRPLDSYDYDYMEIQFYTNGTGEMAFYDDYGYWGRYGFEWDDNGRYVSIYSHGYLYLSRNPYMDTYTVFSH